MGLDQAGDTRLIKVGRGLLSGCGDLLREALFADEDQPAKADERPSAAPSASARPAPAAAACPASARQASVRQSPSHQRRRCLVVADERTWQAAGAAVYRSLRRAGVELAQPLVFPGQPTLYAAYEQAVAVRERLRREGALGVAVGSGTLNDLTKLASGELGQPYAVVATAASMDGYAGFGAPMTVDGVKTTLPCPAPRAVVFDLDVAAGAPSAMAASGYGDLSAKIPGGADWLLADAAGVEPLHPLAWRLVQSGVRDALANPSALAAGDADAFSGLASGLLASGLAMQAYQGTRPASGAEHYFSHLWELDHLGQDAEPLSHGFKVAIGTLAMCAFYEAFLARDLARLDIDDAVARWPSWPEVEADIRARLDGPLADKAVRETREKYVDADGLRARLRRLAQAWPELSGRLRDQLVPARQLQRSLAQAGAPAHPEDIGLTTDDVKATFPKAMYFRSRYTVLDVAREAGWFDELVDEVFAPGGLWT
ncbi:MAG: sn-glycerol-1-phosphate dehydrogenase [Propionibacteriaceae bacterium]|jgi:glycerol-1-phosphate dehydrogenase [NAD(P)+]|nr:sn-glycerol-1-phosphate dehydrogenase [Propionibacteriaceae bacterium]